MKDDTQDINTVAADEQASIDAVEARGALFMPEDTVVGRRQANLGATQMQK
jgi:hypothetical protein